MCGRERRPGHRHAIAAPPGKIDDGPHRCGERFDNYSFESQGSPVRKLAPS
jgi:hypothetical protein